MDRRFLTFIALSFLVLTVNSMLVSRRLEQQKKALPPAAQAEAGDKDAKADGADKNADPAEQKPEATDDALANQGAEAEEAGDDAAADAPALDKSDLPSVELVTLGSVDKDSPYRMLATLTNEGAGVRRIELASPRYLDMHDRSGYLGHLELESDEGKGLLVRAVGAGTPASAAGLKVGDRLLAAGRDEAKPLSDPRELELVLEKSKPGAKLTLKITRDEAASTLTATLARRPLELTRPESANYHLRNKPLPAEPVDFPSFRMTLDSLGKRKLADGKAELPGVRLLDAPWKIVDRAEDSATFRREIPAQHLAVTKRFRLAKATEAQKADPDAPDYHLTLEITLENTSADAASKVGYRLEGPNGLPIEGWWYLNSISRSRGVGGLRDVIGRYFGADPQQQSASAIDLGTATDFEGAPLAYMSVVSHYFGVAMIPQKDETDESWTSAVRPIIVGPKFETKSPDVRFANTSFRIIGKPLELAPGKSVSQTYEIFAGPKRPELLAKYVAADNPAYTLGDLVYYGWFGGIARAMIAVLHFFYAIVRNYGVAIFLLTIVVRGCMFPISRGQAKSMAKMQMLKPEMDKLKEKFKGDQQKQAAAMQQLYRKHKINPLAGCLPMFLQLPVFMGLWRALAVDVELRQAPLLGSAIRWCSNLAAPDMLFDWSGFMPASVTSGQGPLGLGPYFNVFPLVTLGLFLWQQKMMMPAAVDDQTKMQQTIMKYMSVLMGILFYKVPSGLCVYLITSSLWGIGERKLVPPATAAVAGGGGPDPAAKRIVAALDKRAGTNGATNGSRPAGSKKKR